MEAWWPERAGGAANAPGGSVAEAFGMVTPADGKAGLRSLLFLATDPDDAAAPAVREAALDLGLRAAAPVLLLDLATPGNAQHRFFAEADRLVPRQAAMQAGPPGFAALHFQRVQDTRLYVTRVEPDPAVFATSTWREAGSTGLPRLLRLFGAMIIAAPDLRNSPGGLGLAAGADGVVLVLRRGRTFVEAAASLNQQVQRAGGRPVGVVMTDCPPDRRFG